MDKNERLTRLKETEKRIEENSRYMKPIPQGTYLEDVIQKAKQDRAKKYYS